jgi:hypothetical protein
MNYETLQTKLIINKLRAQVSDLYSRIYFGLPKPKEQFSDYTIFFIGYIINKLFVLHFPDDIENFNVAFILDTYHLIFIEINGIKITDYYI